MFLKVYDMEKGAKRPTVGWSSERTEYKSRAEELVKKEKQTKKKP